MKSEKKKPAPNTYKIKPLGPGKKLHLRKGDGGSWVNEVKFRAKETPGF